MYGAGGVGKTTLAIHIHDELYGKLQISVEGVYWVTVSNGTTISALQSKIAIAVDCDYISKEDVVKKRAGSLRRELLRRKNSLLILDDVWKDFTLEEVGSLMVLSCFLQHAWVMFVSELVVERLSRSDACQRKILWGCLRKYLAVFTTTFHKKRKILQVRCPRSVQDCLYVSKS